MEQEINKKEQELQDNAIRINKLKQSKRLLKKGLDKFEKISKSKSKENDELKNEIEKFKRLNEQLTDVPIILQDVKKRDDKARTFVPPHKKDTKKIISDFKELLELKDELKDESKIFKDDDKHVNINLRNVNDLIGEIKKNVEKRDNIIDIGNNECVNFSDILNFLQDIIDGKVNDFNKEEKYNEKLKDVEKNLENRTKNNNIKPYDYYLNYLKKILFSTKKPSGKGLTISALPILLSKIYTNNSSKEITNKIKQLTKKLYDNKKTTKKLYNILNKALRQSTQHL